MKLFRNAQIILIQQDKNLAKLSILYNFVWKIKRYQVRIIYILFISSVLKNDLLLHEAVIKNEADTVRKVLKETVDVDSRNNVSH